MKTSYLFLSVAVLGLTVGYASHRLSGAADAGNDRSAADSGQQSEKLESSLRRAPDTKGSSLSAVRSTDTLESLKALPPENLYGRLAVWMVDANQEEIAEYWQHYRKQKNRSNEINDLIFINWTRLDPQAAVNAAANTSDAHYPWWAWACHDPAGSLAEVMSQAPDRLNNVTWGLGEFHPDWVREHWDEIPEDGQMNALQGMAKWDDVGNPLEVLTFLKDKGYGFHRGIFKVLISKDPWAAYEMIKETGGEERGAYGGTEDTLGLFVWTVAEQHPEMLEKLASQTPSGELKWKLDSALFSSLLKNDPEAAKQQAMATAAPKIAIDRLTLVGNSLIANDPDQAFEMVERIFAINSNAMSDVTRISYGNGSSSSGSSRPELNHLMSALVSKDPVRAMDLAMSNSSEKSYNSTFDKVAGMWAEQDLQGYADWVNDHAGSGHHLQAVSAVIGHLTQDQNFNEAATWAVSLDDQQERQGQVGYLLREWSRHDPGSAANWLNSSTLTADEIKDYQRHFPTEP